MDLTINIVSIGELAGQWHAPYIRIEAAARNLGIRPAATINYVPYFSDDDVEAIKAEVDAIAERVSRSR